MSMYVKERRKMFRSLADHCHDKALGTSHPPTARDWMVLMDACLWLRDPNAEIGTLEYLFKEGKGK